MEPSSTVREKQLVSTAHVPDDTAPTRLDEWASANMPGVRTRRDAARMLRSGSLRVDGVAAGAGASISPGNRVEVWAIPPPPTDTLVVSADAGTPLDSFVWRRLGRSCLAANSKRSCHDAVKSGLIAVNGVAVYSAARRVRDGDTVRILDVAIPPAPDESEKRLGTTGTDGATGRPRPRMVYVPDQVDSQVANAGGDGASLAGDRALPMVRYYIEQGVLLEVR